MKSRPRWLLLAAWLLLVPLFGSGRLHAELRLLFNSEPNKATATDDFVLRPNVQQTIYVFVENTDAAADLTVTVEVRAGGKAAEGASQTLVAKRKDRTAVFGEAPTKPGEKPAEKPAETKPPTLAPLLGAVEFVLLDKDKNPVKDKDGNDVRKNGIDILRASNYVKPEIVSKKGERLEVKVTALKEFGGPPCRVELVLKSDRIPGLDEKSRQGNFGGLLTKAGSEAVLSVDELTFTGSGKTQGLVYLTVDGYERAFTYSTTFGSGGVLDGDPDQVTAPIMRMTAPSSLNPEKPLVVNLETDNVGNDTVELALGRGADKKFRPINEALQQRFSRVLLGGNADRRLALLFSAKGPAGALLFKPELRDWTFAFDVKGIFGPRLLRLRSGTPKFEKKDGKDVEVDFEVKKFIDSEKQPFSGEETARVEEITKTVVLDGTPPVMGDLVYYDKALRRGRPLRVGVTADDKESGIKRVMYYPGKPGADGKPPAGVVPQEAEPANLKIAKDKKEVLGWVATLDAPTDTKPKVVTFEFTNGADLTTVKSLDITLSEAAPATPATPKKSFTIKGKVEQGGRAMPKVVVVLRGGPLDAAAAASPAPLVLRDSTLTLTKDDEKAKKGKVGEFEFKDVPAGSYRVIATRTGDGTRGEEAVTITDKDHTGLVIKLTR